MMSFLYLGLLLFNLYYLLLYFQEAHYHFNSFFSLVKKIFKNKINYLLLIAFLLELIISIFKELYSGYQDIIICVLVFFYLVLRLETKYVLKLKFTPRIIRNIITNILICFCVDYFLLHQYDLTFVLIYFNFVIVFLSLLILAPLEKLINKYYLSKAKKKLNRVKPLVIAITGSAGKTSVKNYLYTILKEKYLTFMTPKSYNTVMGICRCINKEMNEATEVAIIECGASQKDDIKKILKLINVDISIITSIFPQHLETFKTVENIVSEKQLIAKNSLVHIEEVNSKYPFKNDEVNRDKKILTFGFNNKATIYAKDITYSKKGSSFIVSYQNKSYWFKTSLLGEKAIMNILACLLVGIHLNIDMIYLRNKVKNLVPVKNRLELRIENENKKNEKVIIYDCFNSNYYGFLDAIKVCDLFCKKKVIITPGLVSGGKYLEEYNKEIAKNIIKTFDECLLVDSNVSKYLKVVFDENLFTYHCCSSFNEAFSMVNNDDEAKTVLIENDITDIYK